MANERRNIGLSETVKNAVTGYTAVVLGTVCFLLSLAVVGMIVRLIVGAGAGA